MYLFRHKFRRCDIGENDGEEEKNLFMTKLICVRGFVDFIHREQFQLGILRRILTSETGN